MREYKVFFRPHITHAIFICQRNVFTVYVDSFMMLVEKFNVCVMPTYTGIFSDKHPENYLTKIPFIYIYLDHNDECVYTSARSVFATPYHCTRNMNMFNRLLYDDGARKKRAHIQYKTRINGNNKQKTIHMTHTHTLTPSHPQQWLQHT